MRNFNLERMLQVFCDKKIITDEQAGLLKESAMEFLLEYDLLEKMKLMESLQRCQDSAGSISDLENLDKQIAENQSRLSKEVDLIKQEDDFMDILFLMSKLDLDEQVEHFSLQEKKKIKKIYLFIMEKVKIE